MTDFEMSEQADWSASLTGDSAAFARLFDRHRDVVFRQALRLLQQPADAEEVASAAFFELWRKRASVVVVVGSVRPWLLVTTANLARNSHRVRLRREQFLRRLATEHQPDSSGDLFDQVDAGVQRKELVAALLHLKPDDVALVTMTALDGYAVREVAGLLGLSDGAARVRLSRAHAKLRDLLPAETRTRITSKEAVR